MANSDDDLDRLTQMVMEAWEEIGELKSLIMQLEERRRDDFKRLSDERIRTCQGAR